MAEEYTLAGMPEEAVQEPEHVETAPVPPMVRNARWTKNGNIDAEYSFDGVTWTWYSAVADDIVQLSRDIFAQAMLGIVADYVPPSPEQAREVMSPLTSRQIRLALLGAGIDLADVDAALDALPDGAQKAIAKVEWQHASTFNRTHPMISLVGSVLSLTDEQIDTMWVAASQL